MLRRRRVPDLTGKQAVPYRITSLDGTHTNRKSPPDERIVLARPVCRLFWGIFFRLRNIFVSHQESLSRAVQILSRNSQDNRCLPRIIHQELRRSGSALLRFEVVVTFGPSAEERADDRVYFTTVPGIPSDPA